MQPRVCPACHEPHPQISTERPSYGVDDMPPNSVLIAVRVGNRPPRALGFRGAEFQWQQIISLLANAALNATVEELNKNELENPAK